jgi:hypothetical protein
VAEPVTPEITVDRVNVDMQVSSDRQTLTLLYRITKRKRKPQHIQVRLNKPGVLQMAEDLRTLARGMK